MKIRKYNLEELYGEDEVFITNSVLQIMPVVRVDDKIIGEGVHGKVVQDLIVKWGRFLN